MRREKAYYNAKETRDDDEFHLISDDLDSSSKNGFFWSAVDVLEKRQCSLPSLPFETPSHLMLRFSQPTTYHLFYIMPHDHKINCHL